MDEHDIANTDILFVDIALIVQGGAGDGGAGDEDGGEFGDGCENAGAADLDGDVVERGFLLLGQEFVGGGPARGARGEAELLALGAVEHLDDRAVGAVVEVVAVAVDVGDGRQHFVEVGGGEDRLVARDAEVVQQLVEIVLGVQRRAVVGAEAVGEEGERAFGDDFRIELLEGSGGGVAGIGEGGQAGLVALGVQRGEGFVRHEDLAADFEEGGDRDTGCWLLGIGFWMVAARFSGMLRMVRTLWVTSSPVVPSPRVAA